jgi:hypothetical protein
VVGCGKTNEPEYNFTLEDIEIFNTADAIFKTYNSVRSETVFYDYVLDSEKGERGDFTQTSVYVKDGGGVRAHTAFSDGYSYTIEKNWLCYMEDNGEYGINALFDDGYFEAYFEPFITKWLFFSPDESDEFVGQTTQDGVTTVIYRERAEDMPDAEMFGLTEGEIIETTYKLDAASGLLQSSESVIFSKDNPGSPRLQGRRDVIYGEDDDYLPEYVKL